MSRTPSWGEVSRLFDRVVERPAGTRRAWLDEVAAHDPQLRAEVRSLLAAHEAAEGFLEGGAREAPAPSIPGGRYRILRELGRGGMGVVYEARDTGLERRVAIKVLAERLPSLEATRRFRVEARAISALDHPGICAVHDLGETADGRPFLVLALYEGETLDRRLDRGPLDPREAEGILVEVLRALEHAHGHGVVHRDVKPSNLMWTTAGAVKVLDFGVASVAGRDAETRSSDRGRLGTPAYMAPELLLGEPPTPAVDLWSVGVVVYEMLVGRLPYPSRHPAALVEALLDRDPDPLPEGLEVPRGLREVLERTLVRDPAGRASTAAELLAVLGAGAREHRGRRPADRLPRPLTSFVGRERELAEIGRLLSVGRLVTLVGPGGAGKTRLAIEAARALAGGFDGTDFVSVAALQDPALFAPTLARGLGFEDRDVGSSLQRLGDELGAAPRLLVVDNLEHLVELGVELQGLLERCPGLALVVTSRIRLRVGSERILEVAPLEARPDPGAAAVRLFLDRALAVRPDLSPEDLEVATVAEICRRLDGLPLAIELAAARIRLFSVEALRERLDRRFELLRGGERDRPDRHRTLEKAITWSYDLLPAHGQALFRRLAVFRGGFSIARAEAVVHAGGRLDLEPTEALADLLDQSLVVRGGEIGGEPRFQLLETLREYALERLAEAGEEEATRDAHAREMADLAERAAAQLSGGDQKRWVARLEAESENVRAALEWAGERGPREVAVRLGASFWRFWLVRGPLEEGCRVLQGLATGPGPGSQSPESSEGPLAEGGRAAVPNPREADLLQGLGTLQHNLGRNAEAERSLRRCLALRRALGDRRGQASVLAALGWVACETSELERAESLSGEARDLAVELGEPRDVAVAVNNLAWIAAYRGDFHRAERLFEESRTWRDASGDRRGSGFAAAGRAWAELRTGRTGRARKTLESARGILREVGDLLLLQWVDLLDADVSLEEGDAAEALRRVEAVLAAASPAQNRSLAAWAKTLLAEALCATGDRERARREAREARAVWEEVGTPWGAAWALRIEGQVERADGRPEAARALLVRSLSSCVGFGDLAGAAAALEGVVACGLDRSDAVDLEAAARDVRRDLRLPLSARGGAGSTVFGGTEEPAAPEESAFGTSRETLERVLETLDPPGPRPFADRTGPSGEPAATPRDFRLDSRSDSA